MNDLTLFLFLYFAQFVPRDVSNGIFIQPHPSRKAGYSQPEADIMNLPGTHVIPAITRYVVSVNENFVAERIRNLNGFMLFVEYGKIRFDRNGAEGVRQTFALTVAHPFGDANADNPNEALLMNEALHILHRILQRMDDEQREQRFCGITMVTYPVEIRPVDPVAFYGCGGWTASFTNAISLV
jgi:hypothetical protein